MTALQEALVNDWEGQTGMGSGACLSSGVSWQEFVIWKRAAMLLSEPGICITHTLILYWAALKYNRCTRTMILGSWVVPLSHIATIYCLIITVKNNLLFGPLSAPAVDCNKYCKKFFPDYIHETLCWGPTMLQPPIWPISTPSMGTRSICVKLHWVTVKPIRLQNKGLSWPQKSSHH